jgi:hypothetical protein
VHINDGGQAVIGNVKKPDTQGVRECCVPTDKAEGKSYGEY